MIWVTTYKSPCGPPLGPASPSPVTFKRLPDSTPGGIFEDLFGGGGRGGRRSGPKRGSDLRYNLEITLEDAALGKEFKIEIPRAETCGECKGTGASKGSTPQTCPDCSGSGQVRHSQGFFSVSTTCGRCGGRGQVISNPCKVCRGEGTVAVGVGVLIDHRGDDGGVSEACL